MQCSAGQRSAGQRRWPPRRCCTALHCCAAGNSVGIGPQSSPCPSSSASLACRKKMSTVPSPVPLSFLSSARSCTACTAQHDTTQRSAAQHSAAPGLRQTCNGGPLATALYTAGDRSLLLHKAHHTTPHHTPSGHHTHLLRIVFGCLAQLVEVASIAHHHLCPLSTRNPATLSSALQAGDAQQGWAGVSRGGSWRAMPRPAVWAKQIWGVQTGQGQAASPLGCPTHRSSRIRWLPAAVGCAPAPHGSRPPG